MSEPNFDTLAATQKLQDSSFERRQAEGVIGAIADAQQNLATKDDLKQVEDRLTGEIKLLSGEIKGVSNRLDDKFEVLDGKIAGLKGEIGSLRTIMLGAMLPVMVATLGMVVVMFMGQE